MKKTILLVFPLVLFLGLFVGCSDPKEPSKPKVNKQSEINVQVRDVREAPCVRIVDVET